MYNINRFFTAILSVLLAGWLLTSCNGKPSGFFYDYEEAYPEVTIDSVATIAENTVAVFARITKLGDVPLKRLAVSIGDAPGFAVWDNPQDLVDTLRGDRFIAYFEDLPESDSFYAIAFVGHEYGLSQSEYFPFRVNTIVPPEAPCNYPPDQMGAFGSIYDIRSTRASFQAGGDYRVEFSRRDVQSSLDFQDKLTPGVYKTVGFDRFRNSPQRREANAFLRVDFVGLLSIVPGGKIYVSRLDNGEMQLEACELYFVYRGDTLLYQFNVTVDP